MLGRNRGRERRRARDLTRPSAETLRADASSHLTTLADALARGHSRDAEAPDQIESVLLARTVAETLMRSNDVADLIGAVVVARTGLRDLEQLRTKRTLTAYRPCFFNPVHQPAYDRATWRVDHATVSLPACSKCLTAIRAGHEPEVLRLGRRGHPYYERDDIWARTGFGALVDDLAAQVMADRMESR